MNNIIYGSIDAGTNKTALSVWDDTSLITYRLLKANPKEKNVDTRIEQIRNQIVEMVEEHNIAYLIFEDVPLSNKNLNALKALCKLQGVIMEIAMSHDLGYYQPLPNEWRKQMEFSDGTREGTKRENLKKKAIEYVNQKYNLGLEYDPKDKNGHDDIAESLAIHDAFIKFIKE